MSKCYLDLCYAIAMLEDNKEMVSAKNEVDKMKSKLLYNYVQLSIFK